MTRLRSTYPRTLAISLSTRGFGFAVIEGRETLVDWGVKSAKVNRNAWCREQAEGLIAHYAPEVMVLQDHAAKDSRRAPRIRSLSKRIIALAEKRKVRLVLLPGKQAMSAFFPDGKGTKHERAELLAKRFPEELGSRLPAKRKPWQSEDYRMDIFDAVALALVPRLRKEGRTAGKA